MDDLIDNEYITIDNMKKINNKLDKILDKLDKIENEKLFNIENILKKIYDFLIYKFYRIPNFSFLMNYKYRINTTFPYIFKLEKQSTPSFINEENSSQLEVLVYPNPFSKTTTVRIINGKGPYLVELFDMRGKVVKSLSSNQEEFLIDGINASSGIYWLKIKNQSNLKPLKLVIE